MGVTPVPFAFDAGPHTYTALDTGERLQGLTDMLEHTGWIDRRWYSEESSERGTIVHGWTAKMDDRSCTFAQACEYAQDYSGWLAGHHRATLVYRPVFHSIECPLVHPVYRFGGRLDRVALINGVLTIIEIKTGQKEKSHQVQTALQAILASVEYKLPPERIHRVAWYERPNGKVKVEPHDDLRDFAEARAVIKACCGGAA